MSKKILKRWNEITGKWERLNEGPKGEKGDKGERGVDGTVNFSSLSPSQKASLKGVGLNFKWDGTKLGIKCTDQDEYEYVDLVGQFDMEKEYEDFPTHDKTILGALKELFILIDDGKSILANAISDKGISCNKTDSFERMADYIRRL